MRTTKVMAFSVMPEFEIAIQKHAKLEHRTTSEYIREAVRQYMSLRAFDATHTQVMKRLKRKGLKASVVDDVIDDLRKRG